MDVAVISPRILVRQALCALLSRMEIIDEVMGFGSISGPMVAHGKSHRLVFLIHATEPCGGIDSVRQLRQLLTGARAILLTDDPSEEFCVQSLKAGAWGCVSTSEHLHVLLEAFRKVARDECWFGRRGTNAVLERIISGQGSPAKPGESLTPRESEVLTRLARGRPARKVGGQVSTGKETERFHVKSIYRKLQVTTRRAAVLDYFRNVHSHNTLPKHSGRMTDSDVA